MPALLVREGEGGGGLGEGGAGGEGEGGGSGIARRGMGSKGWRTEPAKRGRESFFSIRY